jgi:hypothetical protein
VRGALVNANLAPQCVTYDRRLHLLKYDWKLARRRGMRPLPPSLYPPSSYLTTGSETITIVK